MSDKQITLMQIALDMGKEYATALSKTGLDEEAMETAVLGFKNELNVLEQLSAGESPENLRYLIMASTKSEFDINDFFDETGSFINYDILIKQNAIEGIIIYLLFFMTKKFCTFYY